MEICSKCKGNGFILFRDDKGREIARPCECRERMIAENRLKASGISESFQKKTFESFNTKDNEILSSAKSKAMDYADNFEKIESETRNSALFIGQVGCGKTHLSMAIANKLLKDKNVGVVYMPYRETMTLLKQLAMDDKYKYEEEMHRLINARVLVIDDLFKGSTTEADINYMFQIVNTRYLNNKPFICSSEKNHLQLLDIDEAIGSRLIEQAKGHTVWFREDRKLNHRLNG